MATGSSIMGTYVLGLHLGEPRNIVVGRLGEFEFPAGWYLYVGSARGPGGLRSRLARHRRRAFCGKRLHWHADYMREHATWGGAWGLPSDERLECEWAALLSGRPGERGRLNAQVIAPGFGASDCLCASHLLHVSVLPDDGWFARTLDAKRIDVENAQVERLLLALTTGPDQAREASALALGRLGTLAVEALAAILGSGDADMRWWAARALAEADGTEAVRLLVCALVDPDPDVRACAALALGRSGTGSVAPALAARLADESAYVACIAADAVSMLGVAAVDALSGMLDQDSARARLLAVRALGRIKSQQTIGSLLKALEDPSYLVSFCAREALEDLDVGIVYLKP